MTKISRTLLLVIFAVTCLLSSVMAHEMRPGCLQLKKIGPETYDGLWNVPAAEQRVRLGIYERFFEGTVETREHRGRLDGDACVARWSGRFPDGLTGGTVFVDGLRRTMTDVLVRIERLNGKTLVSRIMPSEPDLEVVAAPSFYAVADTYFFLGVEHILLGIDHLLFVLALLILVKNGHLLIGTITAFTLAHSVTLVAATLGWVAVPGAPVEAVIALSVVFVASEIVQGRRGHPGLTARRPWLVAMVFGLIHGFGFAGALHEIGLPEQAISLALLLFNLGVEVGQVFFVVVVVLLINLATKLARRINTRSEAGLAWAEIPAAYVIGSVACMWLIERIASFGA